MSIKVECSGCGEELTEPGGLIFTPPQAVMEHDLVWKLHLCVACWGKVALFIKGME